MKVNRVYSKYSETCMRKLWAIYYKDDDLTQRRSESFSGFRVMDDN